MEELLKEIEEFGETLDLGLLTEEGQEIVRGFYEYLSEKCKVTEAKPQA